MRDTAAPIGGLVDSYFDAWPQVPMSPNVIGRESIYRAKNMRTSDSTRAVGRR